MNLCVKHYMMEMKDMFQNIGFTELLLIAVVALVLFGPNKRPEIGRVLGRTIRDFKKGAYELLNDEPSAPAATSAATPTPAAVQQAPQASPAAAAGSEQTSPPAAPAAPAAEQPAVKAAVSFVSSGPAVVESDASPAAPHQGVQESISAVSRSKTTAS